MEQLRRVPFGELKIGPRLRQWALAQNQKAKAILQSSANLGKSLGLSVVAEGAETQDRLGFAGRPRPRSCARLFCLQAHAGWNPSPDGKKTWDAAH